MRKSNSTKEKLPFHAAYYAPYPKAAKPRSELERLDRMHATQDFLKDERRRVEKILLPGAAALERIARLERRLRRELDRLGEPEWYKRGRWPREQRWKERLRALYQGRFEQGHLADVLVFPSVSGQALEAASTSRELAARMWATSEPREIGQMEALVDDFIGESRQHFAETFANPSPLAAMDGPEIFAAIWGRRPA